MRPFLPIVLLAALSLSVRAEQPRELAMALQNLRDQRSYSWEIINGDPGPVATEQRTRRGTFTAVRQNNSPHVKGSLTANGEMLVQRDWPDGLRMDTFVSADGIEVTHTPEGWMTGPEILAAIAEERTRTSETTDRLIWLQRADRPDLRRPDQELAPFIKGAGVTETSGESFITRARVRSDGWIIAADDDSQPSYILTFTLNVRRGTLRDYEVRIEGAQRLGRSGVQLPVNDDRIVIITYVPVTRLDVPDEARAKNKRTKR